MAKRTRKLLSLLLTCTMVVGMLGTAVSAADGGAPEPVCGLTEHTHTADCYTAQLICGQEESAGHVHSDACCDENGNLICGLEESSGHAHDDTCYSQDLTCEIPEHTHSSACYAAPEHEHVWDAGTVTTPASCTEEGVMTYACTDEACGETKTEPIPAAGHSYVDGVCTVCEAEEFSSSMDPDIDYISDNLNENPDASLLMEVNGTKYLKNIDWESGNLIEEKVITTSASLKWDVGDDSLVLLSTGSNGKLTAKLAGSTILTGQKFKASFTDGTTGYYDNYWNIPKENRDTLWLQTRTWNLVIYDGHQYEILSEKSPTCTDSGSVTKKCFVCGRETTESTPAFHSMLSAGAQCEHCGKVFFTWDEATKTLTFAADIPNYAQNNFAATRPYEQYAKTAEHVVVDEGVAQIGSFSFSDFSSLVSFGPAGTEDGEAVLDVPTIGSLAFRNVKGISRYTFTENVASFDSCLYNCGDLEAVVINNIPEGFTPYDLISNSSTTIQHLTIRDPDGIMGQTDVASTLRGVSELTLDVKEIRGGMPTDSLESLTVEGAEAIPSNWLFDNMSNTGCSSLKTVVIGDGVGEVGDFAFQDCFNIETLSISENTKLGYSNIFAKFPDLVARMEAILDGKFVLGDVETDDQLTVPDGWTDSKIGTENTTSVPGTQVTKAARWVEDTDSTQAEVQLQFSYTEVPGKDFLFVVDYSGSMSMVGNPATDHDSKFADMQSKLLDVTEQLLAEGNGYQNRIAMVSFSDNVKNSLDFTSDLSSVQDFIRIGADEIRDNTKNPYGQTNYSLALQEAREMLDARTASGYDPVVIFISDGMPNLNQAGERKSINELLPEIQTLADAVKRDTQVIGVLQSVSGDEEDVARYENVMRTVCSDGLFFSSHDTEGFSRAVNDAIGSAFGTYTLTDVVNDAYFVFDGAYTITADGADVTDEFTVDYDENTHTLIWDLAGALPYTDYVLTFTETLKSDNGSYPYGTFDTNEGDAVITVPGGTEAVNTVATPQLSRSTGGGGSSRDYYDVTVNYYDQDGNTIRSSYTTGDIREGRSWDVTDRQLDTITYNGATYTFDRAEGDPLSGTNIREDKVVDLYYTAEGEDIPDPDTPTTDQPTDPTDPGTTDPTDPTDPTQPGGGTDLEDPDVPTAEVPETGDASLIWAAAALLSGIGLAWLVISGKKREENA